MKRNGMRALDFHGPALVERDLTYLRGTQYANRVVALCFLPYVGLLSADEIDRHAVRFDEVGATLLIVSSGARPLHRLWNRHLISQKRRFWQIHAAGSVGLSAWW